MGQFLTSNYSGGNFDIAAFSPTSFEGSTDEVSGGDSDDLADENSDEMGAGSTTKKTGIATSADPAEEAIEGDDREESHGLVTVSYTHLTLPTNREV